MPQADVLVGGGHLWSDLAVGQKRYPKWNLGRWKHKLKPAVPWWLMFDPYPFESKHCRVMQHVNVERELLPAKKSFQPARLSKSSGQVRKA